MKDALLADLIVAVHLGIVVFVIAGELLVVVGAWRRWRWIRSPIFRLAHLAVIAYVALQAFTDQLCPLTVWEERLRARAGEARGEGTFIGRLLHDLLFVDVPQDTLNGVYVGFAALVLLTWIFVPPRWPLKASVAGKS